MSQRASLGSWIRLGVFPGIAALLLAAAGNAQDPAGETPKVTREPRPLPNPKPPDDPALKDEYERLWAEVRALESPSPSAIADLDSRVAQLSRRVEPSDAASATALESAFAYFLETIERREPALTAYERAVAAYGRNGLVVHPWLSHRRAQLHEQLGRFDEALRICDEAIPLSRGGSVGEDLLGSLLMVRATAAGKKREHDRAAADLEEAEAIFFRTENRVLAAQCSLKKGWLFGLMNRPQDALRETDRSIALFSSLGFEYELAYVTRNRADCLRELDRLDEAVDEYRKAGAVFRAAGARHDLVFVHIGLGRALLRLLRGADALREFDSALRLAREIGDSRLVAQAEKSIAFFLQFVGRYSDALAAVDGAIAALEAGQDASALSAALVTKAICLTRLGSHDRALDAIDRAVAIARPPEMLLENAWARQVRVEILRHLRRFDEAIAEIDAVAEAYRTSGAESFLLVLLSERGSVLVAAGRIEEGLLAFDSVFAEAERSATVFSRETLHVGRADALVRAGRPAEALVECARAADLIESMFLGPLKPLGDSAWQSLSPDRSAAVTNAMASLDRIAVPTSSQIADAFRIVQVFKGREMAGAFAERRPVLPSDVPADVAAEHAAIVSEIREAERGIWNLERLGVSGSLEERARRGAERAELTARLERSRRREDDFLLRARLRSPSWTSAVRPAAASLAEVRSSLPPGAAFLEYVVSDGGSARAFVLTRAGSRTALLGETADLSGRVERALAAIGPGAAETEERAAALRSLGEFAVDPLLETLGEEKESISLLLVAPDGDLCRIPFEALLLGPVEKGTAPARWPYLVGSYGVAYAHSGTALREMSRAAARERPPGASPTLVAFGSPETARGRIDEGSRLNASLDRNWIGEPLPFSAEEALDVALFFAEGENETATLGAWRERLRRDPGTAAPSRLEGSRYRVYLGSEARESVLANSPEVRDATVLHLACHGRANASAPSLSGIALAAPRPGESDVDEDGFVTVGEFSRLVLSADLVALSACETHAGPVLRFEGLMGLSRAAFAAGGRSVLATLWRVPDREMRDVMSRFYAGWLKEGLSKPAALAAAKRKAIADGIPAGVWAAPVLFDRGE